MLNWLIQNLGTIIVALVLCALVVWIVKAQVKVKKRGGSSCGSGCSGCSMSGSCHKKV